MVSRQLKSAIDKVLKDQLAQIGYVSSEIEEDIDHDGEPILMVTIHYKQIGQSIDPSPTFSLARYVRSALSDIGETRYPHFRHLFPEGQNLEVA